jgi:hypothetical protein
VLKIKIDHRIATDGAGATIISNDLASPLSVFLHLKGLNSSSKAFFQILFPSVRLAFEPFKDHNN